MSEIKTGIYKITSPSNKIYVGQSINILNRESNYKINSCKSQVRLYNSIQKYGFENHLFEIIEECKENKLNERERFWQDKYNVLGEQGLNCKLTKTDDKSGKHSDETKKRIGESNKGKVRSAEQRKKMSDARQGIILSTIHKENISISRKGKPLSDETKAKMSERMKNTILSVETRKKISESKKGKKRTAEHTRKISDALRGKKRSEETRKKISAAKQNISDETKEKISEGLKKYNERKRNEK